MLQLLLRVALYVQLLLGLARFFGPRLNLFSVPDQIWDWHIGLAVVIAILALLAFRSPVTGGNTGIRMAARFMPLVTLAVGLLLLFETISGLGIVVFHMLLGIVTVALVEMASAQERHAAV